MKKIKYAAAGIFLIAILFTIYLGAKRVQIFSYGENKKNEKIEKLHRAYEMDASKYGNLENISKSNENNFQKQGLIVSHHFIMAKEIAKTISIIKEQKPKTIIIFAPNHFNVGNGNATAIENGYATPWGNLEIDSTLNEEIIKNGLAIKDDSPFENEHSISSLVGFIKYYSPQTKIVPILLKRNMKKEDAQKMGENIFKLIPKDSMVIASVDFSHHLGRMGAQFHDNISIGAIESFDFEKIYNLELDSPSSITILLKILQLQKAGKMEYFNTSSADYFKDFESDDVTSYLFASFEKGDIQKNKRDSALYFNLSELDFKNENSFTGNAIGKKQNFLKGSDLLVAKNGIFDFQKKALFSFENSTECPNGLLYKKETGESKMAILKISRKNSDEDMKKCHSLLGQLKKDNFSVAVEFAFDDKKVFQDFVEKGAELVILKSREISFNPYFYNGVAIINVLEISELKDQNEMKTFGIGMVKLDSNNKRKYYLFPFTASKNNGNVFLNQAEAEKFCNQYLSNVLTKDGCAFEN
jgi:AmmeMemoRadiSam system protein B